MIALPDHISHILISPLCLQGKGEHTRHNPVSSSFLNHSSRWRGIYDKGLYLFISKASLEELFTSSPYSTWIQFFFSHSQDQNAKNTVSLETVSYLFTARLQRHKYALCKMHILFKHKKNKTLCGKTGWESFQLFSAGGVLLLYFLL